jgi:hypothetical protein
MTDHKLPLLYVFERKPEIEREEGFLLAGVLAIDPIIPEAEFEEVTLSIIQSLLRMLLAGELGPQIMGWMDEGHGAARRSHRKTSERYPCLVAESKPGQCARQRRWRAETAMIEAHALPWQVRRVQGRDGHQHALLALSRLLGRWILSSRRRGCRPCSSARSARDIVG